MTRFHETGKAPVWNEFLAQWNAQVQTGKQTVRSFEFRPAPGLRAIKIETQEILQQQ